jgi:hypothetical protein
MRLRRPLPWITPLDLRSGLQVETGPLGPGHLPSYNLAEDSFKRNFFRDQTRMVSH